MSGLREKKKQQTRERIATAAVKLLASVGEANATVAKIAERAEISPRTFHNYFPRREEAFCFFFENLVRRWIMEITNAPAEEQPIDLLKRLALTHASLPDDDPYSAKSIIRLIDYMSGSVEQDLIEPGRRLFQQLGDALFERTNGELGYVDAHVLATFAFFSGGIALQMNKIAPYQEVLQSIFTIFDQGVWREKE